MTEIRLGGRHFYDEECDEELKRFSQNAFQECSQHLYRSWQKCRISQGTNMPTYIIYVQYKYKYQNG
jgi:hypothetical protein